jgi:hypothetical protein
MDEKLPALASFFEQYGNAWEARWRRVRPKADEVVAVSLGGKGCENVVTVMIVDVHATSTDRVSTW